MARQVIVVALIFTAVVGAFAADTKTPASSPSSSPVGSPSTAPTSSSPSKSPSSSLVGSPSHASAFEVGIEVPNPGGGSEDDTVDDNADYGGADAPTPGPEAAEGPEPPADVVA
ncbi:hypothetical protein V6N13_110862 [Hibiscus sabdariffa]|uniref:Classical arabinogalactan protein 11-like n=1 Tax=Hibiscus sabdariffa TaxID=183260 RepID=A0ABR2TJF0_9ROSI